MNYQYLLKHPDLFQYAIGITHRQFELLLPKFTAALRQAESIRAWSKHRVREPGGGGIFRKREEVILAPPFPCAGDKVELPFVWTSILKFGIIVIDESKRILFNIYNIMVYLLKIYVK